MVTMLKSKIHRATVTQADLNYMGSITIDCALLEESGILPHEKVLVVNNNNGQRFETYVIAGEKNSGVICLNGAAARLVQPGDIIIILAFIQMEQEDAKSHIPKVVFVDQHNKVTSIGVEHPEC